MALEALYADISPQPHHLPLVAAAGVLLPEPDNITELDIYDQSAISVMELDETKSG